MPLVQQSFLSHGIGSHRPGEPQMINITYLSGAMRGTQGRTQRFDRPVVRLSDSKFARTSFLDKSGATNHGIVLAKWTATDMDPHEAPHNLRYSHTTTKAIHDRSIIIRLPLHIFQELKSVRSRSQHN